MRSLRKIGKIGVDPLFKKLPSRFMSFSKVVPVSPRLSPWAILAPGLKPRHLLQPNKHWHCKAKSRERLLENVRPSVCDPHCGPRQATTKEIFSDSVQDSNDY